MAKISHREKILLGYGSNSQSNCSSRRNSEVDFSDVFGGPPRCSSTQESYINDIDDSGNDLESADGSRSSSLFGLREKPVFGEQIVVRRRYTSEDFFDDIFGGDQPLLGSSLSPRIQMPGRNPFSSAPGSRVMSPSRPLCYAAKTSATPSKFSLPESMTNTNMAASTSFDQSLKSCGRTYCRFNKNTENNNALYGDDIFSIEDIESTSDGKLHGIDFETELNMNSNDDIKFHFSIYKWRSKGIPFIMSSRKRSPSKRKESFTSDEGIDSFAQVVENSKREIIDDASLSLSKRRMPCTSQIREPIVYAKSADCSDDSLKHSPHETKSNMKPLCSLLNKVKDGNMNSLPFSEIVGNEKTTTEKGENNKTKIPIVNDVFSSYKVKNMKVHNESSTRATNGLGESEPTGKVRDFIKVFNKDPSSNVVGQSRSSRWNQTTTFAAECQAQTFPPKIHHEEKVDRESFLFSEKECTTNGNDKVSEPFIDDIRDSAPEINATSIDEGLDKAMVQDIEVQLETKAKEETQNYERKVKQWSKGKEGNIRALLSTMQYVLWPNSGWKAIPLVDIIEANAVKKSYQRALLCLHPDKLQQKGASPYQKLIAEKVFDLLQEAWEQFNSLGLL